MFPHKHFDGDRSGFTPGERLTGSQGVARALLVLTGTALAARGAWPLLQPDSLVVDTPTIKETVVNILEVGAGIGIAALSFVKHDETE